MECEQRAIFLAYTDFSLLPAASLRRLRRCDQRSQHPERLNRTLGCPVRAPAVGPRQDFKPERESRHHNLSLACGNGVHNCRVVDGLGGNVPPCACAVRGAQQRQRAQQQDALGLDRTARLRGERKALWCPWCSLPGDTVRTKEGFPTLFSMYEYCSETKMCSWLA